MANVRKCFADLPASLLEKIFLHLDWKGLITCESVCMKWRDVLLYGNNCCWEKEALLLLPSDAKCLDLLSTMTHKAKIMAYTCAWNKGTVSQNFDMLSSNFSIRRRPIAQSSDVARSSVGFSREVHQWVVRFDSRSLGSHAGVGICTSKCSLHGQGYYCVLGENDESWGWNIVTNELKHGGRVVGSVQVDPKVKIGDTVVIVLNADSGTVSFELNNNLLGTMFEGLPSDQKYYACISSVFGDSVTTMVYSGFPYVG